MTASDDFIMIGRIRRAHGVRGELAVEPFTSGPDRFQRLTRIYLGDRHEEFAVKSARTKSRVFLTLEGVTTRDDATRLAGRDIWIPIAEALELPEGQFYSDQIIGLVVEATDGTILGPVVDLIETPANDVYIVKGERGEVLIPAIRDVVREIDPEAGRIVIQIMPGLLD